MRKTELQRIKDILDNDSGLDISDRSRQKNYVYHRWIYFSIAFRLTKHSLVEIGKEIDRDHATVLYGIREFDYLRLNDKLMVRWNLKFLRLLDKCEVELNRKEKSELEIMQEQIKKKDELITELKNKIQELKTKSEKYSLN